MGETEEYFPRGGKKPTATYFKQSGNFLGAPEKGEKKKKRPKKKSEIDDGYLSDETTKDVDQSYKNCAFGIYYNTIKPGALILGRVQRVQDTKVSVMLPSRMTGTVMACHISETYNKQLEAYVNDQVEKVIELSKMFRLGQYVALKVLELSNQSLMLSMMPQHVNSGKTQTDLHNGALLQAAVSSVEDHGYVMDLGIPNTRAFLPKAQSNPELELEAGKLTWCVVKSTAAEGGVVTLSNTLQALQGSVQRKPTATLLPATALEFTVDKPLDNGIEGQVFGDTTAYIQRYHADMVRGKKPNLGQRIRARVLYVMPIKNTPYLTMKNIFEVTYPNLEEEQKLKEGDVIEEAQVLKITGKSIHFKLAEGSLGVMSLKRVQIDEDLNDEEVVAKSYPIGSTHKVRVLCYNMADYVYSVTDESSVIGEKYFSVTQLSVGDMISATVKAVEPTRLVLKIGRFTGIVPQTHVSDAGVYVDPKVAGTNKLLKKFKVGQQVRARVLLLDAAKSGVYLTMKPTLLSPDLPVLAGYDQAVVGKAYTGTVKYIRDYILVVFFNNVIAIVPRSPAHAYHVGQIVNCTILRVDVANKKMTASLTTAPFWPAMKPKPNKRTINSETEVVPAKKLKTDSEELESKNKKKKNVKHNEEKARILEGSEVIETDLQENYVSKKKKKDKAKKTEKELDAHELDKSDVNDENVEIKKKKKDKKNLEVQNDDEKSDLQEAFEVSDKKKKKNKKIVKENEIALEQSKKLATEMNESEVLMPQDLQLIDLSDCVTGKNYKKRVVSLIKAIKARTHRINRVEKKIENIELEGLNPKNKIYHTAMQTEKITLEEHIKKLLETLTIAQEKLKEFDLKPNKEYKKKRNLDEILEKETKDTDKEKVKKIDVIDVKVLDSLEPALDVPSAKNFWSENNDNTKTVQEEEFSSSDDEEKEKPKKKRKKLSIAEKVAKVREEEERVRQMEQRAVESESQPRSSEQFERALLASPDCSQLWIAYMAFHLQSTEIEKARAVGRKAINAISFREEEEKLNVWLAMINCENRFGTKESQQKILEEALQMNEPFKVHSKLLDIYVETSKSQEVITLVDLMMRKYKRDPNTYIMCGGACFKLGLIEKARQVMQKSVATLEKKEHVQILVQFALLERSLGERERAEALFEQILAVYPQRVDVCSTYIDMLTKTGDIEQVRQVMERMTAHKLPARKMKILYKKWVDVEEKYGSPKEVERIQNLALEFVKKAKF